MIIEHDNAMEAWLEALDASMNSPIRFMDENNNECHEILGLSVTIMNPDTVKEPLIAMRSMGPWHYPTNEELGEVIMQPNRGGFPYTYGNRIFAYNNYNQIEEFIIPLLSQEPNSRRAVLTVWDPIKDSNHKNRNVPGLIAVDFKLREGKINVTGMVRSADLLFGWPANIYQISLLQEYVSKRIGCNRGMIKTYMTSAHVFTYQYDYIEELLRAYSKKG
ncbi:MAG: thymidylate synthase [Candidatus Woesearchaeota archaeon]